MFNRSFLKILSGKDPLEQHYSKELDIFKVKKDIDGIIKISPSLLQYMKKPQKLLKATEDYYFAIDIFSEYKYICFKNLLMIDIDVKNYFISETFIKNNFSKYDNHCFSIYKSRNGYHVFCISTRFEHRSREFIKIMLENLCDYYYCAFSYIRGCSVRLSKKEGETEQIYIFLGIFGNSDLIDPELLKLVELQYKLSL